MTGKNVTCFVRVSLRFWLWSVRGSISINRSMIGTRWIEWAITVGAWPWGSEVSWANASLEWGRTR